MKFIKRIDAVFVPVMDVEKSEQWYLTMFPFKVVFRSSDGIYVGFRFEDEDEVKTALTIHKVDKMPEQPHAAFNFYVDDVDAVHSYLKEQNVEVGEIHGAEGMRFFNAQDPNGNKFEFVTF
ncbi:VOC family protein [Pontibacillus marinus]|uniref:VOC domain-containing protein n=1 Tax=Pontibacillus marinus BH030004 = DSM 16465 TaxID=1385511 RepID=A0A0A5FXU9_9BACI|nr:VOC family protein [Pontibacillus marinus]KGX84614.1 hypothetical protein N783_16490 [Pontibacillus marinus BH030004 = DSM 16465]